ncbi:MAG: phosphoadenylyl-sulfate reductase [Rhodobacteraceae bacterium]|nr:phosphoadenylyl-sulfate reductase [Paracoccaceae bacterium]
MPLEYTPLPIRERAADLTARWGADTAEDVLAYALDSAEIGTTALVSSFGAESIVLLHMVARIDRTTPVIFLNTGFLFRETRDYQRSVAAKLRLTDLRVIEPDREELFLNDPDAQLHRNNPDACCDLRKTRPLARALEPFEAWITGRKRIHGGRRVDLPVYEADGNRLKINPLTAWSPAEITTYMRRNGLPKHPLVDKGFKSIGCDPCTTRVRDHEDARAGRWRGKAKTECGIHFDADGAIRPGAA